VGSEKGRSKVEPSYPPEVHCENGGEVPLLLPITAGGGGGGGGGWCGVGWSEGGGFVYLWGVWGWVGFEEDKVSKHERMNESVGRGWIVPLNGAMSRQGVIQKGKKENFKNELIIEDMCW